MTRKSRQTDKTVVMPILAPILGEELALAVIEHRDMKREPMTAYAARLQVAEYLKCGDPVAAAQMQILRSWVAIKASWFLNEKAKEQKQAQQQVRTFTDAARRIGSDNRNVDWFGRSIQ